MVKFLILSTLLISQIASAGRPVDADSIRSTDHTKTISLCAATDTMLCRTDSATVSGKSLSGSSNTFTNIPLGTAVTGNLPTASLPSAQTWPSSGTVQAITPNNHGVMISGSGATATVIAPDASTSKVLTSGGSSADPVWSLVSLTAGVTGTLPLGNGGTGQTTAIATYNAITPATQAISASAIDWATGAVFTKTLGANTTFTFSNQTSGQVLTTRITNTASNWTVTWPSVKWPAATAPTQTVGATSDVCTFVYDGTNTYGSCVQDLH